MIRRGKIWAFIPARSGSKSIKNKNIKRFCNRPLIFYTFDVLKYLNIKNIIFSSNSKKYINLVKKKYNFETHLRSSKNSKDLSTDLDVFKEFINIKRERNEQLPEYFLHLRPTTPFRRPEVIKKAIKTFLKVAKNYTALRSISKLSNTGYRCLIIKNKILHSMYKENPNLDGLNIARQNFKDTFIANGYVDIIKTETLLKNKIHGNKVFPFLTKDFNSDIDTLEDFENFEKILKNNVNFKKYFFYS